MIFSPELLQLWISKFCKAILDLSTTATRKPKELENGSEIYHCPCCSRFLYQLVFLYVTEQVNVPRHHSRFTQPNPEWVVQQSMGPEGAMFLKLLRLLSSQLTPNDLK